MVENRTLKLIPSPPEPWSVAERPVPNIIVLMLCACRWGNSSAKLTNDGCHPSEHLGALCCSGRNTGTELSGMRGIEDEVVNGIGRGEESGSHLEAAEETEKIEDEGPAVSKQRCEISNFFSQACRPHSSPSRAGIARHPRA